MSDGYWRVVDFYKKNEKERRESLILFDPYKKEVSFLFMIKIRANPTDKKGNLLSRKVFFYEKWDKINLHY